MPARAASSSPPHLRFDFRTQDEEGTPCRESLAASVRREGAKGSRGPVPPLWTFGVQV